MPLFGLFKKNKPLSLFVFFQFVSIILILNRNSYLLFQISESFFAFKNNIFLTIKLIENYFNLKDKNEALLKENLQLKKLIYGFEKKYPSTPLSVVDSFNFHQAYEFIPAKLIRLTLGYRDNYFVIDKGKNDGVDKDMAVITSDGIIGIILNVDNNYSQGISVLSSVAKINARLKRAQYFGTLVWNGKDCRTLQLLDIPRFVDVKIGDTVETDGKSELFPEGLPIGRVAGFALDRNTGFWLIDVEIFPNMAAVDDVQVIKKLYKIPNFHPK